MALVKCPDCGREVSDQAPSCPNCGRPMAARRAPPPPPAKKSSSWPAGCLILGFLGFCGLYVLGSSAGDSSRSSGTSTEQNPKIGAVSACKRAVNLQLKAPGSAEFAPWEEWTAYRDGTKRVVNGWVDAQNSFGAKLRSDVRCEVYDEGSNYRAFAHLTAR